MVIITIVINCNIVIIVRITVIVIITGKINIAIIIIVKITIIIYSIYIYIQR